MVNNLTNNSLSIKKGSYLIFLFLLFSFIVCFFNTLNSPFYLFNEWCDPQIYFSIGKGIFNGKVPYKDLFDHKGPLIYFIYGIGYLVSNTSLLGIYLIQSCFWFLSILFAYRTAKLFLSDTSSFIIALLYTTILYSKSGAGGSADEFIVPVITISFYYFLSYFNSNYQSPKGLYKIMLIQGFTFAFAFFVKFSVCVFWAPLILAICYRIYTEKKYKQIVFCFMYFMVGFIILAFPFLLYFLLNNAFADFIFAYFTFNSMYASTGITIDVVLNIAVRFVKLTSRFYIAFPLVLLGLAVLIFTKKYIKEKEYKIGIFFSFVFLYLPIVNSRDHHLYAYIVLYVFAIMGLVYIFGFLDKYLMKKKSNHYPIYILSFICILALNIYNQGLLANERSALFCKENCSYGQKEFAEIINKEHNPTLLDLQLDKGIYMAADIVPSYKYFFHPAIDNTVFPDISEFQKNIVKNSGPMFIVTSRTNFPYLNENYTMIATYTEMQDPYGEIYLYKRK